MRLTTDEQEQRVMWSVKNWNRVNFVTATLREEVHDPKVISKRWTAFIKALKRWYFPKLRCIRVIQKHEKGHGYHIHALLDRFVPCELANRIAEECGLGRINFEMVSGGDRQRTIGYVVRYINRDMKHRHKNPALKGVRLLTASGSSKKKKEHWWKRYCDLVVQDSGLEFRKALQSRLEVWHANKCVFRTWRGRTIPLRMVDLLRASTEEDIAWAHQRTREVVAGWN